MYLTIHGRVALLHALRPPTYIVRLGQRRCTECRTVGSSAADASVDPAAVLVVGYAVGESGRSGDAPLGGKRVVVLKKNQRWYEGDGMRATG